MANKYDVFYKILRVEHITLEAENEKEAESKAAGLVYDFTDKGIIDPAEFPYLSIDVRPVEENELVSVTE